MPLNNLVICDIQPQMNQWYDFDLADVMRYISRAQHILCVYDQTLDYDIDNVRDYYSCWLKNSTMERIQFIAKEYGFFRDLMDEGYGNQELLDLLSVMNTLNAISIEDVDWKEYTGNTLDPVLLGDLCRDSSYRFCLPGCLDIETFHAHQPFRLIGGHRELCLRELELWFQHVGLQYTKNEQFVFW